MKVYLVRHAQTDENAMGILQGAEIDSSLNALGLEQARRIGFRLADISIRAAYSSDLKRAVQTADEILRHHQGISLILKEGLRERKFGELGGKHVSAFAEEIRKFDGNPEDFRPAGGESMSEFRERIISTLSSIIKDHQGEDILIVSHGTFITNALIHILNIDNENYQLYKNKNTALTILDIDEDTEIMLPRLVACTAHLEDMSR